MSGKLWYRAGLRFGCTRCGNCCTNHGEHSFLYVMDEEVQAIASFLDMPQERFREEHCTQDGGWQVLVAEDERCSFLGPDQRCTIYPVRPVQCRTWPFWEENLRREVWEEVVQDLCPGAGSASGELFSAAEARAIARATEAWYVREGGWRAQLAPLAYMEGELPPAVRALLNAEEDGGSTEDDGSSIGA